MSDLMNKYLSSTHESYADFLKERYNKKQIETKWIKKFFGLPVKTQNRILDKTIEKYNSDKYIDRWEKRSMEPENKLWWILFDYISIRFECESINAYSVEFVINNDYHIITDFGQGSHISMYKKNINTI